MIYYCHTTLWLFHGRLMKDAPAWSELLNRSGNILKSGELSLAKGTGGVTAMWKKLTNDEKKSYNTYPAIDIEADEDLLSVITLQAELGDEVTLSKFRVRITDYGHLACTFLLAVNSAEALSTIDHRKILACLYDLIENLTPFVESLNSAGKTLLEFRDEFYGVPNKIRAFITKDDKDTYTFQELIMLTEGDERNISRVEGRLDPNAAPKVYENFSIYGIDDDRPIWCCRETLNPDEVLAAFEPHNLVLAERNLYDGTSAILFAIIDLANQCQQPAPKDRSSKARWKLKMKAFKSYTTSDLRNLTLNFGAILHEIFAKRAFIEGWQDTYITEFKKLYPFTDFAQSEKEGEKLLTVIINEKDEASEKYRGKVIEAVGFTIGTLTLCSAYIEMITFTQEGHEAPFQFAYVESQILVGLLGALLIFFLAFRRILSLFQR